MAKKVVTSLLLLLIAIQFEAFFGHKLNGKCPLFGPMESFLRQGIERGRVSYKLIIQTFS